MPLLPRFRTKYGTQGLVSTLPNKGGSSRVKKQNEYMRGRKSIVMVFPRCVTDLRSDSPGGYVAQPAIDGIGAASDVWCREPLLTSRVAV